jgi:hypothetical protein
MQEYLTARRLHGEAVLSCCGSDEPFPSHRITGVVKRTIGGPNSHGQQLVTTQPERVGRQGESVKRLGSAVRP